MELFFSMLRYVFLLMLMISFPLAKATPEVSFEVISNSTGILELELCFLGIGTAKLNVTQRYKSTDLVEFGIKYNGNHDCIYYGKLELPAKAIIAISVCDGITGFANREDNVIEMQYLQFCNENKKFKDSYGKRKRRKSKRSANDSEGKRTDKFCGNTFTKDDSKIAKQTSYLRSASKKNYGKLIIPVAVFYDRNIKLRFDTQAELNKSIIAMAKVTQILYKQEIWRSLADIDIVITHVAEMAEEPVNFAGTYLINFQNYQKVEKIRAKKIWEAALLLVGSNVYYYFDNANHRNGFDSSLTGLANVGKLCTEPDKAAGIVEARTMSGGLVMAHELGHILGILHDSDLDKNANINCKPELFVMSATIGEGKVNFSKCSVDNFHGHLQNIEDNKRVSVASCLKADQVPEVGFDLNQHPEPGQLMDAVQQCHYAFGEAYEVDWSASSKSICTMLWCKHNFWTVRSNPALPGTICQTLSSSEVFHCNQYGKCIKKTN